MKDTGKFIISLGRTISGIADTLPLTEAGFAFKEVTTHTSAQKYIQERDVQLLLLRHDSEQDALKALGKLGDRKMPAIIVTTDFSPEFRAAAFQAGANDVVPDPLYLPEFFHRANFLLQARQQSEELQRLNEQRTAETTAIVSAINEGKELRAQNERLEREKSLLSRYFSDDMIQSLLSKDSNTALRSSHLTVTVLFFDLRKSTTIAEKMDPAVFSTFLSDLFTDIMDLIYGNYGSVNKLMGDGMMATFGCPVGTPEDAINCCRAAVQIQEYLSTFNDVLPDYLDEPIHAGIGIATGRVFAGNIGSVRRIEYTVLGDAVNTASRLESMTKEMGVDIVIDKATIEAAGSYLNVEPLGSRVIRGKQNEIEIFHLKGLHHAGD